MAETTEQLEKEIEQTKAAFEQLQQLMLELESMYYKLRQSKKRLKDLHLGDVAVDIRVGGIGYSADKRSLQGFLISQETMRRDELIVNLNAQIKVIQQELRVDDSPPNHEDA